MVLWFYIQEHRKAQLAVVLVLKRLRGWDHSLKFHLTDWEKLGIEPATPGLKGICLSYWRPCFSKDQNNMNKLDKIF